MKRQRAGGFTLVELLVITVVIAILASIALARFDFSRKRGYQAALRSDIRLLASLQEAYWYDNQRYAADIADLGFDVSEGVAITINEADVAGWAATGQHSGLPGEQCGFYFGDASPSNASPATRLGVARCSY